MAEYRLKLTPSLVNMGTEGSMDEHLVGGYSVQRTGYFAVYNSTNRKIVALTDGELFDDVIETFADNANVETVSED